MFKKIAYFSLLIVLIIISSQAYAYDPTVFISSEEGLLAKNEEIKNFKEIKHEKTTYYVVPIYSGETVEGFIATEKNAEKIVNKTVTNTALFKTADFIIEYSALKEQINKGLTLKWFISESNRTKNLATFLESEKNELTLINSELNETSGTNIINEMKTQIDSMIRTSLKLSTLMFEATTFETEIITNPKTGDEKKLKQKLDSVFNELKKLNDKALKYNSNKQALKGIISTSALDIDSKRSLLETAEPPKDFTIIGEWSTNSDNLKSAVDNMFTSISSRATNWTLGLERRLESKKAYVSIFSTDKKLEKIGLNYSTLSKAIKTILNKDNIQEWNNQADLKLLKENWDKTQNYYSRGKYTEAISFSNKTKNNVINVVNAGLRKHEQKPQGPNWDLFFTGIAGILGLLIILIIIKNRSKISATFSKNEEDERIEF